MYSALVAASNLGADLIICGGEMVDHYTRATKPFHDDQRFIALARENPKPFDARTVPDVFRLDTSACKRLYRRLWLQGLGFEFGRGCSSKTSLLTINSSWPAGDYFSLIESSTTTGSTIRAGLQIDVMSVC
jgi:hypothetical protein